MTTGPPHDDGKGRHGNKNLEQILIFTTQILHLYVL